MLAKQDVFRLPAKRENRVKRGSRSTYAYEYIKALLLEGQFKPGERMPIDSLAAHLEISRQPVMEAMRLLSVDGLVEILPQVGCRVVLPTEQEISDFYCVFARIEGLAAELAASRREPSELRSLTRLSAEMADLKDSALEVHERAQEYRILNRSFHGLINQMARSNNLSRFAGSFWDRGDFYLYSAAQHPVSNSLEDIQDEHDSLVAAIAERAADRARLIMEEHMLGFGKRLVDALYQKKTDSAGELAVRA